MTSQRTSDFFSKKQLKNPEIEDWKNPYGNPEIHWIDDPSPNPSFTDYYDFKN